MARHLMAALLLTSLVSSIAAAQQYDTSGSWDAIRIEPCVDELLPVGGVWIGKLGQAGYTTVDYSFYMHSIPDYVEALKAGYGWWFQNSHANQSSFVIGLYYTEAQKDSAWAASQNTEVAPYLAEGTTPAGHYTISITAAGIRHFFHSWGTVVFDGGCYAGNHSSSWVGARAVLAYTFPVDNTVVFADANTVIGRLVGDGGPSLRVLSSALQGTQLTAIGNLNTVISPRVLWCSVANGATINHLTSLIIKVDCPVQIAGDLNYAAFTSGGVAMSGFAQIDPYTFSASLGPWIRGSGSFILRSCSPTLYQADGIQGSTGGIGLDADGYHGPSDLVLTLMSAVDNPAASLSSLTATRHNGGGQVNWRVESQAGTNRYLLYRASTLLGPWSFVASVPADSLRWDYAVYDPGMTNVMYELREVENQGDTLILGHTELRDPFDLPQDPIVSHAQADSLSQASWMGRPRITTQPESILPIYDITYVLPADPTGEWTAAIQPLVADREAKGFLVNIVTMDQVGNSEQGLLNYNINAFSFGLRGETLCGSDEDTRSWDTIPWDNGWMKPSWPSNQQWALIPMHAWLDPIGIQWLSISWFRKYLTSDWHYGDVNGDGRPEIAMARIPSTTPDELRVAVAKILAYEQQDLSHGTYIVADQGRSYTGESGAWASAVADTFAAMIPSTLTTVRFHDTDAAPLTYAQARGLFLTTCATQHVIGMTVTGTQFNRSKAFGLDLTQGDSWSVLGAGQFLSAVAAPTCEYFTGTDRRIDPTYGRGLGSRSFAFFSNLAPALVWASNNGSHQGVNSDLGKTFFRNVYQVGCWSAAEAARGAVYDAAQYSFERDAANGTIVEGDVCSLFPGQVYRTTGVGRNNASQLSLTVDRNPSFSEVGATFSLPVTSQAEVAIFDLQGRRVETLAHGLLAAGRHRVNWHSTTAPSGMYFLRLTSVAGAITQKITYLR